MDVNKGDSKNVDYRSRLVAMEFNTAPDPSLFAPTPPLEAMRYLLHRAATIRPGQAQCVMTVDIKRAYFNALATREVYVEIPAEDRVAGDEDKVTSPVPLRHERRSL